MVFGAFAVYFVGERSVAAPPADRPIDKGHQLRVTLSDLSGPGTQTTVTVIVDGEGKIDLPHKIRVVASGRTYAQLERDIADAYEKARVVSRTLVSVINAGQAAGGK